MTGQTVEKVFETPQDTEKRVFSKRVTVLFFKALGVVTRLEMYRRLDEEAIRTYLVNTDDKRRNENHIRAWKTDGKKTRD